MKPEEEPGHPVIGNFVMIPETTLECEQWRELKPYSRVLFITMAIRYKRKGKEANGRVKWSQKELIETTGIPRSTVCDGINNLKLNEFITVWEPGGRWREKTEYELNPKFIDGKK